jgi:hypothetical protein
MLAAVSFTFRTVWRSARSRSTTAQRAILLSAGTSFQKDRWRNNHYEGLVFRYPLNDGNVAHRCYTVQSRRFENAWKQRISVLSKIDGGESGLRTLSIGCLGISSNGLSRRSVFSDHLFRF